MIRTLSGMGLDYLFLSFMLYSFLGWLWETTACSLWESGKFLNRGSLLGPYCPVYGGGAVLGIVMEQFIPHPAVLFLTSACLCLCCELLCATILEDIFHVKLWDYTGMAFNYKGRVCLLGFLFFGVATTTISKIVEPFVVSLFDRANPRLITISAILLALVLAADTLLSGIAFSRKSRRLYRFYIRYHAMLNREFRSLSRAIGQRLPEGVIAWFGNTQDAILAKNRRIAQREAEYKMAMGEKLDEKLEKFRKG